MLKINLVTCFVLVFCVGAVISTQISSTQNTTFNNGIANGINQIRLPVTILNFALTNVLTDIYTTDPYEDNEVYLENSQTIIAGYLANSFSLIKNEVATALRADANRGFNAFDTYKSLVNNNINIVLPQCTKTATELNTTIEAIFNTGVINVGNCFVNSPSLIFPPITTNANSATGSVPSYNSAALLCIAPDKVISDPNCYSLGFAGPIPGLAPKPFFEASQTSIEALKKLVNKGNVDDSGYTPCIKTAQNNGIQSYRDLYINNPNCFNDYRSSITIIP